MRTLRNSFRIIDQMSRNENIITKIAHDNYRLFSKFYLDVSKKAKYTIWNNGVWEILWIKQVEGQWLHSIDKAAQWVLSDSLLRLVLHLDPAKNQRQGSIDAANYIFSVIISICYRPKVLRQYFNYLLSIFRKIKLFIINIIKLFIINLISL